MEKACQPKADPGHRLLAPNGWGLHTGGASKPPSCPPPRLGSLSPASLISLLKDFYSPFGTQNFITPREA